MTSLNMQPIRAKFATQDQAESVIRKLSALRGDRFRLEKTGGAAGAPSSPAGAGSPQSADDAGMMAAVSSEGAIFSGLPRAGEESRSSASSNTDAEFASEVGNLAPATPTEASGQSGSFASEASSSDFTLSANVPSAASAQARTVILQAGGELY